MKKQMYRLGIATFLGLGTLLNAQVTEGAVGINTGTPKATLDIVTKEGANKSLHIQNTANAETVTVLNNGKVGIGTDNPSLKLDVNGEVRIRKIPAGDTSTDQVLLADTNGNIKKVEIAKLNKSNNHSLVPIDQINWNTSRQRITGTMGSWTYVNGKGWWYDGLMYPIGWRDQNRWAKPNYDNTSSLTLRLVRTSTSTQPFNARLWESASSSSLDLSQLRSLMLDQTRGLIVQAYNGSELTSVWSHTNRIIYAPKLEGDKCFENEDCQSVYLLMRPVPQLWYYDE